MLRAVIVTKTFRKNRRMREYYESRALNVRLGLRITEAILTPIMSSSSSETWRRFLCDVAIIRRVYEHRY